MHDMNQQPLTFASLALALANDYSSIYVIAADDDSYVEYAAGGSDQDLIVLSSGKNFYADVRRNCREQVWPEDQDYFLSTFQKENVEQALKGGKSFSLNYRLSIEGQPRFFFLKTIRGTDESIIIGVRDVDAQMRRELAAEAASRTYSEIAASLASLFEVIYHIDVETGRYTEYSSSESYAKLGFGTCGKDFFARARSDMQRVLHPAEGERIMHELEKDVLLANLQHAPSVSLTYRQILDGQQQHMNLLAFRQKNDPRHIVIGVRNIDAQAKREAESETYSQIAGALASRYEVIYYINVDTHEYTLYSASEQYAQLGTTVQGGDFFADAAADIKKYLHPDDMPRIIAAMEKETLMNSLRQNGYISLSYRQMLGGRQQYMNNVIVQPKNDPHHIIMGVLNTDEQIRKEQTIEERSRTFSDISMALAQRYEVIYLVNIETNEYTEYSTSDQYTRLESGMKGKDFFSDTQRNMKQIIYPDDLPMMSISMQKDNIMNSLSTFGKTFLNYRQIIDGRAQYVSLYAVRPKEDSKHIIIAVANVDAAKRMEIAYQNAMDMANRDALTGVKNKRAYVQAEIELDEQISKKNNPPFAVAVCDVNGLKQVNDTKGHKAGDDFIRSACTIICNNFKHSPVFRIGGDEFAVLLRGQDYDNRKELLKQFSAVLEERKQNGLVLLAAGLSDFDAEQDLRVQDVFERADSMMYTNKEICKAAAGILAHEAQDTEG